MINTIQNLLQLFTSVTLLEMKGVRLMNRIDTKYVVTLDILMDILTWATTEYNVQSINNNRIAHYHTVYLDTSDKRMYTIHETGRKVREKIRIRTYMDSNENFFEIKKKNNHGRTIKKRVLISNINTVADDFDVSDFLRANTDYSLDILKPHIENEFYRITLVNHAKTERLTIDIDLSFHNIDNDICVTLPHLAIIELKRDGFSHSPMKQHLLEIGVRESGFSKYCIGCAMTNHNLRHNNLKEKIYRIEKLFIKH